jgi:HEAT repeat protein
MKVFISWSGERSKRVAQALRIFLQDVNHNIDPWLSKADIAAGSRWRDELAKELEQTTFGIICLTPEAATSPWLLFEAGALSKSVQDSRVCPYLIGMEPKSLEEPLSQFQSKLANSNDTLELLSDINKTMTSGSLTDDRLNRYFNTYWPNLESVVRDVSSNSRAGSPRGRDNVLLNIHEIVQNALSNLHNVDRDTRGKAVEMLASMQHPLARDAVVNALKHPVRDVRGAAARELVGIKDPAAVPFLIEALRDKDSSSVRISAVWALAQIKDPAVVPALIEALRDEDSDVRMVAARALKEIKDPAAVPGLIEALREDSNVRMVAAKALGEIKDPAAVPFLIEALRDKDSSSVRISAVWALGEIKDPAAEPVLTEALRDDHSNVREAAAAALGKINK